MKNNKHVNVFPNHPCPKCLSYGFLHLSRLNQTVECWNCDNVVTLETTLVGNHWQRPAPSEFWGPVDHSYRYIHMVNFIFPAAMIRVQRAIHRFNRQKGDMGKHHNALARVLGTMRLACPEWEVRIEPGDTPGVYIHTLAPGEDKGVLPDEEG